MRPYPSSFFILLSNIYCSPTRAQIKHDKTSLYFPRRCGIIKFTGPPGLVFRVLVLLARLANTLFLGRFDSQSNQLQQRIPGWEAELLNFCFFLWGDADVEPFRFGVFNLRPPLGWGHGLTLLFCPHIKYILCGQKSQAYFEYCEEKPPACEQPQIIRTVQKSPW